MRHLLLTLALLFCLSPAAVRAEEEAPTPIDPVEVGRLLSSTDADEKLRGQALLLVRIARGGDLASFLRRLGLALREEAGRAGSATPPTPVPISPPIPAPSRPQEAPVAPQPRTTESAPLPSPPESDKPDAGTAPHGARLEGRLVAWRLLDVPTSELEMWAASAQAPGRAEFAAGRPVVRAGRDVDPFAILDEAARLPDARAAAGQTSDTTHAFDEDISLVRGDRIRYRRAVRQTERGAWAVDTEDLPQGLQVRLVFEGDLATPRIALSVAHTEVPRPLPTERVRPAPDVEPIEVDRPEWQAARATLRVPVYPGGDRALFAFPEIVPGRVLLVAIEVGPVSEALLPIEPAAPDGPERPDSAPR